MKKTATKNVTYCDFCQKETDWATACMTCEKDMCYECRQTHGVDYNHAIHFSGSGDGHYCKECDAKHKASGADPKHNAYRQIMALREEERAWNADFRIRANAAETAVSSLG